MLCHTMLGIVIEFNKRAQLLSHTGHYMNDGLLHQVIFANGKRDSNGKITQFKFVDQHGVLTTLKLGKYVYLGANLKDQTK